MAPVVLLTLLALTIVLFGLCLLNTGATEAAPADGHGHDHGHGAPGHDHEPSDHAADQPGQPDPPGPAAGHAHH